MCTSRETDAQLQKILENDDDITYRNKSKRGVIDKLIKGSDAKARSTTLRVCTKDDKLSLYTVAITFALTGKTWQMEPNVSQIQLPISVVNFQILYQYPNSESTWGKLNMVQPLKPLNYKTKG